jgi:predicted  nucleic acid-binding Zn-ribbon protein
VSLYLEQIRQLVALQRVDDAIHAVRTKLEMAPQEVDELKRRFSAHDEQRNRVLDKLQHLREQQKRLDSDIEDDSVRIKKSKSKLMQVANNREYQAVVREMDNMERLNRSREEERLVLLDEWNLQENSLKEVENAWKAVKEELEAKQATLDANLADADRKLHELEKNRSSTGSEVPAPILDRYEFIRRRLEHPVIVSVDSGICTGCHIAIPPQVYIELQRGQQILSCPNCQRLIYWDRHFQDPDAVPPEENNAGEGAESGAA